MEFSILSGPDALLPATFGRRTSVSTLGVTTTNLSTISGTVNNGLYQSERYDGSSSPELTYGFSLPNGDYTVNLHFAEIYAGAARVGGRVFGVWVEGQSRIASLDIFSRVGANTALVLSLPVTVTDGQLNIAFVHGVENPKISAIEVLSLAGTPAGASLVAAMDSNGVEVLSPYPQWRRVHFNASELADAALSANNCDPDGDGLDNLMEYALGLDPRVADVETRPTAQIENGSLVLTFTRNRAATDVVLGVEAATLLAGPWSAAGLTQQVLSDEVADPQNLSDIGDWLHVFDTATLPARLGYPFLTGKGVVPGCVHFPLQDFARQHAYDHYWLVENDVEFSGDWGKLIGASTQSRADLIAAHVTWHAADPVWIWWRYLTPPLHRPLNPAKLLRAFFPVYRISRAGLLHVDQMQRAGWRGHYEALIPTLVNAAGMEIADLRAIGQFYLGTRQDPPHALEHLPNAEPIEYDYLLMLEREGQETHLVKDGSRLVKVNVREVLSAIENESQRKEIGGNVTNIYIGGDVNGSNIISGNNNVVTQRIQNSFNKAEAADIQAELKETLKQLAQAVEAMNKALTRNKQPKLPMI